MDKALRNTIIAGTIIIALSVGYYLVIFLPKKETMRLEQQKQEAEQQKQEQKVKEQKETAEKEALRQKEENEKAIKKECAEWALNKAFNNETTYQQDAYDDYFARCLREKGLAS